jgi:hypothetical protein
MSRDEPFLIRLSRTVLLAKPPRSYELLPYHGRMPELVFEVVQESDGGYCAECLTESIFTEGNTWDELRKNVLEATSAFYFDRPRPERVRLHLVRDEVLLVA